MEYLIIIISAVFVNNIVLAQFLGICPFLGVSNKVSTATGMSAAVVFVITLSTLVTYLLHYYVLVPLGIEFMKTIVFILVIAALVQMVEIILKKISPSLFPAADYHQLYCARSGYQRSDQGVYLRRRGTSAQLGRDCSVCSLQCPGLRCRHDTLRRHTRADGAGGCAQGLQGYSDSSDYGRNSGNGIYGIQRTGVVC